jgi:peptidoglycan/xylan/chitin deacetylase (PgdA/CDA1 family)
VAFKNLANAIGIDARKLRGYKWLVKRTIRKSLYRHHMPAIKDSRNPLIFRLDDVGYGSIRALIAIMDVFLVKNHTLSLGLVMNRVDKERSLVEKITYGKNLGLFELVLHGWDHVDYAKLHNKEQQDSLYKSSKKMRNLFGLSPKTFIPPYNSFNDCTLQAMNKSGIRIISSMLNYEAEKDIFRIEKLNNINADSHRTYHVPETASFEKWDREGNAIRIPIKQIIDEIYVSIWHYGYAVIAIHPITFLKLQDGKSEDVVDEHQLNDLRSLLECVESKNAIFTSFSKLTAIN